MTSEIKKRKTTDPPDGYVCNLCDTPGHWIQQCPNKKQKRKKSNHVPVPGVDPSQQDIDLARQYQKIKPPNCFCGQPSRLKKVKKSNVNENSRAVGKYFFFCALKKGDNPCRFARPVDDELKDKKDRVCSFFLKNGSCKKGNKCMFSHEIPDNMKKSHTKQKSTRPKNHDDEGGEQNEQGKVGEIVPKGSDKKDSEESSSSDSDDSTSDESVQDSAKKVNNEDTKKNKHSSSSGSSSSGSSSDSSSDESDQGKKQKNDSSEGSSSDSSSSDEDE